MRSYSLCAKCTSSCCVRDPTCVASHFQSSSSISNRSASATVEAGGGAGESKLGSWSSDEKKDSRSSPVNSSSACNASPNGEIGTAGDAGTAGESGPPFARASAMLKARWSRHGRERFM